MEEMDGQDNTRTIADHADNKQDTDRTGQGGTSTGQTHGRSFFFPLFSFALSTFDMLTTGKKGYLLFYTMGVRIGMNQ